MTGTDVTVMKRFTHPAPFVSSSTLFLLFLPQKFVRKYYYCVLRQDAAGCHTCRPVMRTDSTWTGKTGRKRGSKKTNEGEGRRGSNFQSPEALLDPQATEAASAVGQKTEQLFVPVIHFLQ